MSKLTHFCSNNPFLFCILTITAILMGTNVGLSNPEKDFFDTKEIQIDGKSIFKNYFENFQHLLELQINESLTSINEEGFSFSNLAFDPCPGGNGVIGGRVIGDFNYNGEDDQTSGIEGVTVYFYECDGDGDEVLIGSTTSDYNGDYFISGLTDGDSYRLEFIPPSFLNYNDGMSGAGGGPSIQFASAPDCNVNASFAHPQDYCQSNPGLAASCYVNGDPLPVNSEANDQDALVYFHWDDTGNTDLPDHLANAGEIGSTYGIGYDRNTQKLYISAFIKRFVGLGPLGLGGIYEVDMTDPQNPVIDQFLDVETIGIDVGNIPNNTSRGLPILLEDPSNDASAYDLVATQGIGAMAVSNDGKLWFVNLSDATLYSIVIDSDNDDSTAPSNGDVESFPLPNAGCTDGVFRPFAIKIFRDQVYIGGVCDASVSEDEGDLEAIVYRLDVNTFTEILRFDLDYTKGYAASANNCDFFPGWYPWLTSGTLPPTCDANVTYVYPQPVLTDIEFDIDGSMVLGFMDRTGHQLGNKNWPLTGTSPLMTNISGGDILRAPYSNGSYSLENNGTAGTSTTAGAGNSEGPGGGEFYYQDIFAGPADNFLPPPHSETAQGDLAFYAGAGQVATTALDPYSTLFNSGGVNWFNNNTGEVQLPGYVLYRTSTSSISSFSKANGLGSMVVMCENNPPLEIGGYVWQDANSNGIQDPCESALNGINVSLFDANGNELAQTTADADGEYYFNDAITTISPNTNYFVVAGTGSQYDINTNLLIGTYYLTLENIGGGQNTDKTDSDATIAGNQGNSSFSGMPFISVTTGGDGYVNHDLDFGFASDNVNPIAGIGDFIWDDSNENGIQDNGEPGIEGVNVILYDENDNQIDNTTSNASGNYFFANVSAGNYYLEFDVSSNTPGVTNFQVTGQNQGNGSNDSDINLSQQTSIFSFDPMNGNNNDIDAGYFSPTGMIGGFVWDDENENGIQDNGETGIEGVTVNLINGDNQNFISSTTSNGTGGYSFQNLSIGNYILQFDPSTNTANIPNFAFSPQNQGNGSNDSDPDPNSGQTSIISFDPSNGDNNDVDAGFFAPTGVVGGFVWDDENQNGLQDFSEPGLQGVTIILYDETDNQILETVSNPDGSYSFINVPLGNYYVLFDVSTNSLGIDNYIGTQQNVGNDDSVDSDADPNTGETAVFSFDPDNGNQSDISAGFIIPVGSIGGNVWSDLDGDGIQDNGEPGVQNVTVTLYDSNDNQLGQTTTQSDGTYNFPGFSEGNYYVIFDPSSTGNADYEFSPQDVNADDSLDSDPNPANGQTAIFFFDPLNGDENSIDAGLTLPFSNIGNFVFKDCNNNGIQDNGEEGVPNVPVALNGTDVSGAPVNLSTTTDANGNYLFQNINAGTYTITFSLPNFPTGLAFTFQDSGQNDELDSDANPANGQTDSFTIAGGNLTSYDAGLIDIEAPQFVNPPIDMDVLCNDPNIPDPDNITVLDNCSEFVQIDFEETMDGGTGGCEGGLIITRTWTATDECGNQSTHVQIISTGDEVAPVIINIPDVTVECDSNIVDIVKAVDDCDPDPELVYEDIEVEGECPTFIVRKWTATDACGNMTMNTQKITLEDTTPPVITFTNPLLSGVSDGGTVTIECDESDDITGDDATVMDNCDDVELLFEEVVEEGVCMDDGYFQKRTLTWFAVDNCGNATEISIMVFLVDLTPPEVTIPDDITVDCNSIPEPATPIVSDNCDDDLTIDYGELLLGDTCEGYKLIRVWSVMDDCMNMTLAEQVIVVEVDNLDLIGVPEDITIECDEDKPEPPEVTAENDCFDTELEYQELFIDDECIQKCIRVWTATDECGHEVVGTQLITIEDTTPPEIEFDHPALEGLVDGDSVIFNCDEAIVFTEDDVLATDNCNEVEINFMEMQDLGDCLEDGYLLRMECCWKANDGCGNESQICLIVRIEDDVAPELDNIPPDITINQAFEDLPDPPVVTAEDNCDDDIEIEMMESQVADPDGCGYTLTRTWVATDDCGNQSTASQVITVEDVCDCPDILVNGISVENATCGQENGSVEVMVSIDPNIYNYLLVPSIGNQNEDGNVFTDLPPGSYLLIIDLPDFEDCDEKIFFDIVEENCSDTISVTAAGQTEICLDEAVFDFEGIITESSICYSGNANEVEAISIDEECITLQPANGFLGTASDLICVVHCFNGNSNQCDTTYLNVTVEPEPLVCNLEISGINSINPDCDGNLGSIEFLVSGMLGQLSYDWTPNVSQSSSASNLASGVYSIIVTDSETGCTVEADITLADIQVATLSESDLSIEQVLCQGESSGKINSNTATEYQVYSGADLLGNTPLSDLPAGNYTIVNQNEDCSSSIEIEIVQPSAMVALIQSTPESCDGNDGTLEITVEGGNQNYQYSWFPAVSISNTASNLNADTNYSLTVTDDSGCELILENLTVEDNCSPCALEITISDISHENCGKMDGQIQLDASGANGNVSYQWNPLVSTTSMALGLSAGLYEVIATDEQGCQDTLNFEINNQEQLWQPQVNITNENCDGNNGSIEITISEPGNYTYDWTPAISDNNIVSNLSSSQILEVIITDENGCIVTLSDLAVGIDCTPTQETSNLEIDCNSTIDLCINMNELPGNLQSVTVCEQPSNGSLSLLNDSCYTYQPNQDYSGLDTICLQVCDDLNICDTFIYIVTIEECDVDVPCTDYISESDLLVATTDCEETGIVCLEYPLGDLLSLNITDNGLAYENAIDGCLNDTIFAYSYFTIPDEGENGPYSIEWSINGISFNDSFDSIEEMVDLMNQWDDYGIWIQDANTLNISGGDPQTSYGAIMVVQTATGGSAMLELNTNLIPNGSQLNLEVGIHTLIFTDSNNCSDTLNVEVICIEEETVYDTILLNEFGMHCIDAFELPGEIGIPEIICQDCSIVDLELDGLCLRYEGLNLGTVEITVVLCDDLGFCDTTNLVLTIITNGLLPDANIDADSTQINEGVEFNVLSNDVLNGNLSSISIIDQPLNGQVVINSDNTIIYTPNSNYCGLDAFSYEICNENGCDQASVNLLIDCMTPHVMNGFSPNNDGVNDAFYIENADIYPENELLVYDRWGNLVYKSKNYQNNWTGKYRSNDLPDGTYFYLFQYGNGNKMSGYVQIMR